ncbi:hypothetical protein [Desulfobacula phenolica]|uniref:Hybrid cluster protein-associated redox disulfide domain-containing protein n=1 Tax=Desulfobacula phenolica TaxID=90732 RepID=A0A1H2J836_9BACT|nr:hypothetical protein [Desulfobacula phenolica]SDU52560.1 hypothetical protein SAMN04487931_11129 [Desulfobacula phenolica]
MSGKKKQVQNRITQQMTVLDVVSTCEKTLPVFKEYDAIAGECICCKSLFESIHSVAKKYDFDLQKLLNRLNAAASSNLL